ncbi:centaurin-gamma-1A [Sergentomyia squamirostris]
MNSRTNLQSFLTNSLAIRQEIQRFESVHPSIYAIYDLIELIQDQQIAQQIRDHVVCIEARLPLLFLEHDFGSLGFRSHSRKQ